MVSMISMVSGMGRRWWLAWRCWPAAGHAYRKLISHGMIGHDRSMSSRSADLGVSGRRARRHRTETETQPALTHATDKSVRVEIGLARSALPPSLQPPTLLWLCTSWGRCTCSAVHGSCRHSCGVQQLGRGAGRLGPGARPHRPDPSGACYPVSNY